MSEGSDATVVMPQDLPRIPGYQLLRLLGEGGMAQVFLANDVNLKRQVAVKTMSASLNADPQFRRRFAHEAQIVAGFRHPNIVTVFAYGEADGRHYIVMEYVPGGTLADRLTSGALADHEALGVARTLVRALGYFHEHGIVHRDLKPHNILFTSAGEPVLSDFGIAKSPTVDAARTTTGSVIGSPKYMAPEQLMGSSVSDRADIYGFALVLLEMLTGDVPTRVITTVRSNSDVARLRRAMPARVRRYAAFLGRCLRMEPTERPSAIECVAALDALTASARVSPWRRRMVGLAAILALAAATTLVLRDESAAPAPRIELLPASAALFIDGRPVPDRTLPASPGPHALVVVAPGHFGEYHDVTLPADNVPPIALEPLSLPTFDEFVAMSKRSDAAPEVRYPPYRKLLDLRERFNGEGAGAIANEIRELRALASAGDAAAQLMLFLAADAKIIDDDVSGLLPGLERASAAGYALATYYAALHFFQQHETTGGLDRASLVQLRERFVKSSAQGLGFADDSVREADASLNEAQ